MINTPDRRTELWSAKDALVLKAMSIVLGEHLKPVLSYNCYHLAGNGGAKVLSGQLPDALNKVSML